MADFGRQGVAPDKLENAGWFCFGAQGITHCVPDGADLFADEVLTSTVLAFDGTHFLGTELLIHEAIYHVQPCPQDEVEGGDGTYIDLPDMPYLVCHHFDSPAT